jgi:hypothetical protein
MIVYRLEHRDGYGPYVNRLLFINNKVIVLKDELCAVHNDKNHPVPKFIQKGYYCGFHSMGQLREWFDGYLTKLRLAGYHIIIYYAEHYSKDLRQVVFQKATAQRLGKYKIGRQLPSEAKLRKLIKTQNEWQNILL